MCPSELFLKSSFLKMEFIDFHTTETLLKHRFDPEKIRKDEKTNMYYVILKSPTDFKQS